MKYLADGLSKVFGLDLRIVLDNLYGRFLRTTNTRMKDLTMMMMTTVGNGYLNLMKRSLNGGRGFPHLLEERRASP
jgi:hypothetical protein